MRRSVRHRIRIAGRRASARRACVLAAAVAALAALAIAPAASASKGQTTIFDIGGAAFSQPTAKRLAQLDELQAMGVDTVRIVVAWRDIAPEPNSETRPAGFDPAVPGNYPGTGWGAVDDLVRGADARGMGVLLTPSAPIPDWASRTHGGELTDPDPQEFEKFVTAIGKRYDGTFDPANAGPGPNPLPRVRFWAIWNEPNLTLFLKPQFKGGKSVSGALYRELFLAAQRGLQASGHGDDPILIGETSPGPGRQGTDPITFLRGVFCLNSRFRPRGNCDPIKAAGWAHHPYDPFEPPFKTSHDLINVNSIGRLAKALKRAAGAGATRGRLPIYVTEYGVESVPDRRFGVSQRKQAEFIGIAEYMLWGDPRVRAFSQYLMSDDRGGAFDFQTGLRFVSGGKKKAYKAFFFTLAAQRKSRNSSRVTIWGHVRPAKGSQRVQVVAKGAGGSHRLRSVRTNANGTFKFTTPFRSGRSYQATCKLDDGSTVKSILQRVYVFS